MVVGQIRINSWSVGTASGNLKLTGLPFNSAPESTTGLSTIPLNTQQSWINTPTEGFVNHSDDEIYLTQTAKGDSGYSFITVSDMSTSGNSNRVRFSAVYYTND